MFKGEQHAEVIYFGPRKLGSVRLSDVQELQQVRTTYDPGGIDELATSMIFDADIAADPDAISSEAFNLNNPIIVARFSPDDELALQRFIHDHAAHYDVAQPGSLGSSTEDGSTTILIGGHRRKRSLYQLAERFSIDPTQMDIAASIHENISFAEALRLQLAENVHERPPVQDEARAIERFYRDVVRQRGAAPTVKEFAAQLGFGETKVRDALAFASLPKELQELTETGLLSYSIVKRFKPLQDVYVKAHVAKYGTGNTATEREVLTVRREEDVRNSLMVDATRLIKGRLNGNETRATSFIDNLIKSAKEMLGAPEPLFELMADSPAERRMRASREMSRAALQTATRALEWQMSTGDLNVDDVEILRNRLDELVRAAKQQADSVQAFDFAALLDERAG